MEKRDKDFIYVVVLYGIIAIMVVGLFIALAAIKTNSDVEIVKAAMMHGIRVWLIGIQFSLFLFYVFYLEIN